MEYSDVIQLVKFKNWEVLRKKDQLGREMEKQNVFAGFREGLLDFPPTYRWERERNVFSNKRCVAVFTASLIFFS